jgi:hypothetical protein
LYSYFLSLESIHHETIPKKHKAIEGISGISVCYSIAAILFTCCLGGKMFFAFLGVILDIVFAAGFIAIAIMTRDGATSCKGTTVKTPLGNGPPNSNRINNGQTVTPKLRTLCHMESAVFAVSIIGAFLFIVAALFQLWLGRRHRKEKAYGPSPANGYTSGNGIKFFSRRRGEKSAHSRAAKDAEIAGAAGVGAAAVHHHENGHHTGVTGDPRYSGTTADGSYVGNKYENTAAPGSGVPVAGGYHSGPAGAAVNPYGYDAPAAPGQARSHF